MLGDCLWCYSPPGVAGAGQYATRSTAHSSITAIFVVSISSRCVVELSSPPWLFNSVHSQQILYFLLSLYSIPLSILEFLMLLLIVIDDDLGFVLGLNLDSS
jgi:hypothetical protein